MREYRESYVKQVDTMPGTWASPPKTGDERFRDRVSRLTPLSSPLYQRDVKGHYGCVNSVEFSHNENLIASGGDDLRILLWSVNSMMGDDRPQPMAVMKGQHNANVFAHAFALGDDHVYSGGNDGAVMLHDVHTGETERTWNGMRAVYNLAVSPVDVNVVAASRDSGAVVFYDCRAKDGEPPMKIKAKRSSTSMYAGQFNPAVPHIFSVCSDIEGLALYDTRNLKEKMLDLSRMTAGGCMYGDWNSTGTAIAVNLHRNYPIVLDMIDNRIIRLKDPKYESYHTIKSITFADDDLVMIGSDEFSIFAWKIPEYPDRESVKGLELYETIPQASAILEGHRSIVNHVRYSKKNKVMASCGIEKVIKMWCPLRLNNSTKHPKLRPPQATFSMSDDSDDAANAMQPDMCMEEDISMLRYFDRLVLSTRGRNRMGENNRAHVMTISDDEESSDSHPPFSLEDIFFPLMFHGGTEDSDSAEETEDANAQFSDISEESEDNDDDDRMSSDDRDDDDGDWEEDMEDEGEDADGERQLSPSSSISSSSDDSDDGESEEEGEGADNTTASVSGVGDGVRVRQRQAKLPSGRDRSVRRRNWLRGVFERAGEERRHRERREESEESGEGEDVRGGGETQAADVDVLTDSDRDEDAESISQWPPPGDGEEE